ncbi:kinase-like domain-containing protein [Lineolata rhizophorae]|uniref:Kinase-like domain-containing protein n=1 Tax=Lineolata rhizophorae TaxID=578093 RepID=A0A6A6P521_9PEZI|nr:kinase-like domain-containing protein [Lineolata rhizophorae]
MSSKPKSWGTHLNHNQGGQANFSTRAIIKSASEWLQTDLVTECNEYSFPNVSSCQSIWPLLEVITSVNDLAVSEVRGNSVNDPPPYLALAWTDGDLYEFLLKGGQKDLVLFEAIVAGISQALVPFESNQRVHTDIKGDNIMIDCPQPGLYKIELADLGCATYDGFNDNLRGAAGSAAPEVLEGKGYSHASDLWALGMTLLKNFKEDAVNYALPAGSWYPEVDVIATLRRLYPDWTPEPVKGVYLMGVPVVDLFEQARVLEPFLSVSPLKQQLEAWRNGKFYVFTTKEDDGKAWPPSSEILILEEV